MATETFKKYGDATIYHHGPSNAEYPALVLGARYDSGVKLGPNGEPALTLAYLNPATPQNGPMRGDVLDAVLVAHDVLYLAAEDLTAVGYSDTAFAYPVPITPTIEEQLAAAQKQISDLEAAVAASKVAAPAPVAEVPPAVEPEKPAVEAPAVAEHAVAEPAVTEPAVTEPASKVE